MKDGGLTAQEIFNNFRTSVLHLIYSTSASLAQYDVPLVVANQKMADFLEHVARGMHEMDIPE